MVFWTHTIRFCTRFSLEFFSSINRYGLSNSLWTNFPVFGLAEDAPQSTMSQSALELVQSSLHHSSLRIVCKFAFSLFSIIVMTIFLDSCSRSTLSFSFKNSIAILIFEGWFCSGFSTITSAILVSAQVWPSGKYLNGVYSLSLVAFSLQHCIFQCGGVNRHETHRIGTFQANFRSRRFLSLKLHPRFSFILFNMILAVIWKCIFVFMVWFSSILFRHVVLFQVLSIWRNL